MKRFPAYCISLHSRLLRLYPARFRAEFADEMRDVFAQAIRALGLHLKPALEVAFGVGPTAFPLYDTSLMNPNPLEIVAFLVMLAAPVWGVVFGIILLLMLGIFWSRLPPRQQFIGILAVLAGATPLLFLVLPVGRIVFSWWMD